MSAPEGKPDYQRIDELEQECVIIGRYEDMWIAVLERSEELQRQRAARSDNLVPNNQ